MPDIRIQTPRLELVAADAALLRAEIEDRARFATLLDARVPEEWPPPFNSIETSTHSMRQLESNPGSVGWHTWFFVLRYDAEVSDERLVVGNGGFHGPLDEAGNVEIGYSLMKVFHRRGYGTEAVGAMVSWAFAQGARTVTAQTLPTLPASIRMLEKLGFSLVGPGAEEGVVLYRKARGG